MANSPPLPLSEQILAWVVVALGYGDDHYDLPGLRLSPTTVKKARAGQVIPGSWRDLVHDALLLLGHRPDDARIDEVGAVLRRWDEAVGHLDDGGALPLRERIQSPLALLACELGLRMGALAAAEALRTGRPLDETLWLADPLAPDMFGRVVDALVIGRRQKAMATDPKLALFATKEERIAWLGLDRRTVQRWQDGHGSAADVTTLKRVAARLGSGAESPLRAARAAQALQRLLARWIGTDGLADLRAATAAVGRITAAHLVNPAVVALLFDTMLIELRGEGGETLRDHIVDTLPPAAAALSRSTVTSVLGEARTRILAEAEGLREPLAAWFAVTQVAMPHPALAQMVRQQAGGPLLRALAVADPFAVFSLDWQLRYFFQSIARGAPLRHSTPDGCVATLLVPPIVREAADRWSRSSLRFTVEPPPADALLVVGFILAASSPGDHTVDLGQHLNALFDPALEPGLPDALVSADTYLCALRAYRLASADDQTGALVWLGRRKDCLVSPPTGRERPPCQGG